LQQRCVHSLLLANLWIKILSRSRTRSEKQQGLLRITSMGFTHWFKKFEASILRCPSLHPRTFIRTLVALWHRRYCQSCTTLRKWDASQHLGFQNEPLIWTLEPDGAVLEALSPNLHEQSAQTQRHCRLPSCMSSRAGCLKMTQALVRSRST